MNTTFPVLEQYRNYMLIILGRSELTVKEYTYDLMTFFRFLKKDRKLIPDNVPFEEIPLEDIDEKFISKITTDDLFVYLIWLSREKNLTAASRARKISCLKSFFKYCCSRKHYMENNPAYDLESPKIGIRTPKYLTLDESRALLDAAQNETAQSSERDLCMLTLFLNCGMRLSELRGIDIDDIHGTTLTVIGKGNKERTVYLNEACINAINEWESIRNGMKVNASAQNALFITKRGTRISDDMIQVVIKRLLFDAGIDTKVYSVHKLRHTAATLMYKYGHVDIRSLQCILGHKNVSTTQIYTHVDEDSLQNAINSNPLANYKPKDQ